MVHSSFAIAFFLWILSCGSQPQTANLPVSTLIAEQPSDTSLTVNFEKDVLPILKSNCNPCHFPGGKMYETMPFDQATTLTGHAEGILKRFKKDSVVAIETFIATKSSQAVELEDGWTFVGDKGGFVAQHEHTIVITKGEPIILTETNEIWN